MNSKLCIVKTIYNVENLWIFNIVKKFESQMNNSVIVR